ncbi:MAG: Mth938-like domain-containing protein [Notoacmeibacter sp.]
MAGIIMREAHYPGQAPIDAYGNMGFRFAGMSHRGSILCLPSGIHGWGAHAAAELTLNDFGKAIEECEGIEIMLVGTGMEPYLLPRELRASLREAGLKAEIMTTGAAVSTFNILVEEGRRVAAALIAV